MTVSTLKTARVPDDLVDVFRRAEDVVSRFFDKRVNDPSRGSIEIAGERYILVRAASLSVEFFALVEKLYGSGREDEARAFTRNILFDLAHAVGKSDAQHLRAKTGAHDPIELMSAGPILFAHSGWAFVELSATSNPVRGPDFNVLYDHPYSFESDAWRAARRSANFPVCIMNAGYSSGWCEESFSMPLVASEVLCRAKGDDCCRFVMAPPDQIKRRVEEYIAGEPALKSRMKNYEIPDFFVRKSVEEELRAAHDELEQRVIERTKDLRLANERLRVEMEERERILRRLQNTQRLESLGRLAGGVAHDFNNLLGVIMGYSSMLQGRVSPDDPTYAMLAEITDASQLAANLTRQLLMFSRAQVIDRRNVDVNEVVSDVTQMLQRLVGDDVLVRKRLDNRPAVIDADVSQVEQMLMNLAVNARDAMPEGGTMRIETELVCLDGSDRHEPTHVKLSVSDTGVGMDDETLSKIYEPFFSTKDERNATGLGLSTVYGIVSRAGGAIAVDSAPDLGARFDIVLPLAQGPARTTPTGETVGDPRRPNSEIPRSETILLVEDRIGLRALIANLLGESGYQVLVAHDTGDALRIAQNHPRAIHCLLTDVIMPGINGGELAEKVLEFRPHIKVLFMSGYADDPGELEGIGTNSDFIAKPFTPGELDTALRQLLG